MNGSVEKTVSTIRDVQNRAISVAEGRSAWGFRFSDNPTAIEVFSIEQIPGTGSPQFRIITLPNETEVLASGTQITQYPTDNINIIFVSPFGTPYLTRGDCQTWTQSQRPSLEIEPTNACETINEARFTIKFQEKSAEVTVNKGGDVEVKM